MSSSGGGDRTAIDPKLVSKLPAFTNVTLAVPCNLNGRAAAISISASGVAFASMGMFGASYGGVGFSDAELTIQSGLHACLRLYGKSFDIEFCELNQATEFVATFEERKHVRGLTHSGSLPLQLSEHEKLLSQTQYIGGAYLFLEQGNIVDLAFRGDRLELYASPAREGRSPLKVMSYSESFSLNLSGPGARAAGGGFSGGGFGLVGAAEGIAIAAVLNAITRKSDMITVVSVADLRHEGFFVTTSGTPDDLRRELSPIFVRLGQYQKSLSTVPPLSDNLISRLERLSELHSVGALNSEEFAVAKATLLSKSLLD